jgi:hypothetical protein
MSAQESLCCYQGRKQGQQTRARVLQVTLSGPFPSVQAATVVTGVGQQRAFGFGTNLNEGGKEANGNVGEEDWVALGRVGLRVLLCSTYKCSVVTYVSVRDHRLFHPFIHSHSGSPCDPTRPP